MLNNPAAPVKRMMALPTVKQVSPVPSPREVMQSSLTESAQDLAKNPFGDDDSEGGNPFGDEESSQGSAFCEFSFSP